MQYRYGRISSAHAESLERCRKAGISAEHARPEPIMAAETDLRRELLHELIDAAQVHVEVASRMLAATPHAICIADRAGILVRTWDNNAELRSAGVSAGHDWAEPVAGTNGIGTALAAGEPVSIIGDEHLSHRLRDFSTAAAPIRDQGRIIAAAGLITPVLPDHLERLALITQIANTIERELQARRNAEIIRRDDDDRQRLHHALRSTQRRVRRALEVMADPVLICVKAGGEAGRRPRFIVEFANAAAAEFAGRTAEEILQCSLDEVLPVPLESVLADPSRLNWFSAPKSIRLASTNEAGDIQYRTIALQAAPLNGGYAITWREITSAEMEITAILDSIADGSFAIDRDWRFTYVNRAMAKLSAQRPEQMLGRSLWHYYPTLEYATPGLEYRRALEERVPVRFEIPSPSGKRWYATHAYPSQGGLSVWFRDITAEKRAMEAEHLLAEAGGLLASTLDYDTTLRSIPRLVIPAFADLSFIEIVEQDGRTHSFHAAAARAEKERVLVEWLRRESADSRRRVDRIVEVLANGKSLLLSELQDVDALLLSADSAVDRVLLRSLEPNSCMIVPLIVRGRTIGAWVFATAESDRQYDANDLRVAEKLAYRAALAIENAWLFEQSRKAIEARDEVLRVVSHDLRNPIYVVDIAVDQILDALAAGETGAAIQRRLRAVQLSAKQMSRLVRDLLDTARMQGSRLTIDPAPCDVVSLITEIVDTMASLAAEKGIRLEASATSASIVALADRDRILQVVSNLVGNAIKFTPREGRIVVAAERLQTEVRIRVADTGPGIDPEHQSRIFDRFYQAPGTSRSGAGLGLAICKGIVESHGGRIWVESEPGNGSTFCFTLPLGSFPDPEPGFDASHRSS